MSTQTRKYELKARAESQRETGRRIAKAAAELHEEIGVARTTVAEIARRAGVQRLTVYNHFPELSDLLPACSAHYMSQHPLPDLSGLALDDPGARVRAVLRDMYGWYRETEPMMGKLHGDRSSVPALDGFMRENSDRSVAALATALAEGFGARGSRAQRLRALLVVALGFATWQRLDREGLGDDDAAELMSDAVTAI